MKVCKQTVVNVCVEQKKRDRRGETEARRRTWQERFAERGDTQSAAAAVADTQEAGRKRLGLLYAYCQFVNVSVPFIVQTFSPTIVLQCSTLLVGSSDP